MEFEEIVHIFLNFIKIHSFFVQNEKSQSSPLETTDLLV